jgi:DNA processing protein
MHPTTLTTTELAHWLALWYIPSIGPSRFFALLKLFPKLSELFKTPSSQLSQLGLPAEISAAIANPPWHEIEANLRWAEQPDNHLIVWNETDYPQLLAKITNHPPLLFVRGSRKTLNTAQLAIVGSRKPSPIGIETAQAFAQQLSACGLTITSGLALGIDTAAHQGAVMNAGKTIAVLGCGLARIYPQQNHRLAQTIVEKQGALVSEYPCEVGPQAKNFPRRNRLVSGMSLGVLVVEATLGSGSLITANLSNEQGREVFAIPGSIHNPLSQGCHNLIRQGAKLVETVQDILEELNSFNSITRVENTPGVLSAKNCLDAEHHQLLQCIGYETTSVDQLCARSSLPIPKVSSIVQVLELQGWIVPIPGGYMKRKDK